MKKYIEDETKEQRKRRKQQEKLEKPPAVFSSPTLSTSKKNYVLCLKHGTKYDAKYVNRLYNMIKRNCTLEYEFVCLTENPKGLNENISVLPLPSGLQGWWYKPYIFSKDLPLNGTVLYLDLDVVIAANIDKLFTYHPEHWCTVRDFTRAMRPKWHKYNSSIIRFNTGELDFIWNEFIKDSASIQRKYFGDQDYLYEATRKKQAMLYPDSWIQSWKWEVRKNREYAPGGRRGARKLKYIEDAVPRPECCVTVFHGDPNPEMCDDPWVVDNWR